MATENINIKQIKDGDEVFYPQTDIHGLVNAGEYAIDDEPTLGSDNLVKSGGIYDSIGVLGGEHIQSVTFTVEKDGYYLSNYGVEYESSDYNIIKIDLNAGDYLMFNTNLSKYQSALCYKRGSSYIPILVGGTTDDYRYLAKEDISVYASYKISESPEYTKYGSVTANAAFNAKFNSDENGLVIDKEYITEADAQLLSANHYLNQNCVVIEANEFDILRIYVHKGDYIRMVENASKYVTVFAKVTPQGRSVLLNGAAEFINGEYCYRANYTGLLDISKNKNSFAYLKVVRSNQTKNNSTSNRLEGKNMLCLGDSITEFKMDSMGYPDWIALKTGATVCAGGIGGTRLSARAEMVDDPASMSGTDEEKSTAAYAALDVVNIIEAICTQNFTRQIAAANYLATKGDDNTAIISRLQALNKNSIQYITIFAGTNDWYGRYKWGRPDYSDADARYFVDGAINYISYLIGTYMPNAIIVGLTPIVRNVNNQGGHSTWSDVYRPYGFNLGEFSIQLMKFYRKNHIPCCDLYYGLSWNEYNYVTYFTNADKTHPFRGFEIIADKIIGFINSGYNSDNELCETFESVDSLNGILDITQKFVYGLPQLLESGKYITNYGNVAESPEWDIKTLDVTKGDIIKVHQGSSQYVGVISRKEGNKYIPLVVSSSVNTPLYFKCTKDEKLYISHSHNLDNIAVAHSDSLGLLLKLIEEKVDNAVVRNEHKDLYISDSEGNVIAKVDEEGVESIGYRTEDWRTVNDGLGGFIIADKLGNVALKLDKKHTLLDNLGELVKSLYCTPQVSWIDDDFSIFNRGTTVIRDQYQTVHDWCVQNDIKLDFAYIPTSYMDTPDDREKIQIAKAWQLEGFRFLIHPIHEGWYTASDGSFVHDIEKVQTGIVKCIQYFQINNFVSNPRILVYPGATASFPDNIELLTKYVDCAIAATQASTNHGVEFDRYDIQRYALQFDLPGKPKSVVKSEILSYLNRGDWVILYTHLYNYSTEDILDETTNSIANVLDVVDYVNSYYKIRPTEEIWSKRKFLYDYFKR